MARFPGTEPEVIALTQAMALTAKAEKSLFQSTEDKTLRGFAPLAVRMRPKTIDKFVGQEIAGR